MGVQVVIEGAWLVAVSNTPLVTVSRDALYEDDGSDEHVRAYVSRLWAEDWDSPEDSLYDDL